jgi:hypothetical protein
MVDMYGPQGASECPFHVPRSPKFLNGRQQMRFIARQYKVTAERARRRQVKALA